MKATMTTTPARLILALLTVCCLLAPAAARAEGQKIGWIDAQKILDESKAGKAIKSRVEAYRDSRQAVIDTEEKELKELESKLEQQMTLLTDDARRTKQAEFKDRLDQYQKKVLELTQELQDKKVELLTEFNDQLSTALGKVATKGGYDFIFDHGGESALVFGNKAYDLTDQVLAEIDAAKP